MSEPQRWDVDPAWYATWNVEQASRWDAAPLPRGPLISIVMPCYNTPVALLHAAIDSVRGQSYPYWELCLADDGSTDESTVELLEEYERLDERIQLHCLQENQGIAAASNAALALTSGSFVIPMDHDDLLPRYALAALVECLNINPAARLVYSDADRIDSKGQRSRPFFKVDWNYDLFLAQNYLNHLTAIEAALLHSIGGWREGYEGSQDYDLYLRVIEQIDGSEILHIPHVLYHWREVETSFSQSRLGAAVKAARRAIRDHLARTGRQATVSAPPGALIYNYIRWSLPEPRPRVALVLLGECSAAVNTLVRNGSSTLGMDIEVQWADCSGDDYLTLLAQSLARNTADVILLLNGSAAELPEAALQEIVACSLRPEAGCVGLKCLDSEGRMVSQPEQFSADSSANSLYGWLWSGAAARCRGYFGHLLLQQCTDILPPDAIAFRRAHLESYGRLDSRYSSLHLAVADLCFETAAHGFPSIWQGASTLQFDDNSTLREAYPTEDLHRFREHWRNQAPLPRFAGSDIDWIIASRD
jgi:hypothetical protein